MAVTPDAFRSTGNTAARPAEPSKGHVHWNTQTEVLEQWNGSTWEVLYDFSAYATDTDLAALDYEDVGADAAGTAEGLVDAHEARVDNPHNVTRDQLGIEHIFTLGWQGDVETGANPFRLYNIFTTPLTIQKVHLSVTDAPTGQALVVDVHREGTTVFTTQANRPEIADGENTGSTETVDSPVWGAGEYLTVEVDQVGSTSPGSYLLVTILTLETEE